MGFLRVITGFIMGWIIMRLVRVITGAMLPQTGHEKRLNPKDANALNMERCPTCGVYASGACASPQCSMR